MPIKSAGHPQDHGPKPVREILLPQRSPAAILAKRAQTQVMGERLGMDIKSSALAPAYCGRLRLKRWRVEPSSGFSKRSAPRSFATVVFSSSLHAMEGSPRPDSRW